VNNVISVQAPLALPLAACILQTRRACALTLQYLLWDEAFLDRHGHDPTQVDNATLLDDPTTLTPSLPRIPDDPRAR
jgi:hypothetical protein